MKHAGHLFSESYVNHTFVNVEWVSAWLAVIRVNMKMMMTMRRRSRMMRLRMSLSSSS